MGFGNRWYRTARRTATPTRSPNGLDIRLIAPPVFLATKLEAFRGRGQGDFLASHDLEDIIVVVDGRPELTHEIRDSEPELREYLVREIDSLLSTSAFVEALPGYLPADAASQARLPTIRARLSQAAISARGH